MTSGDELPLVFYLYSLTTWYRLKERPSDGEMALNLQMRLDW